MKQSSEYNILEIMDAGHGFLRSAENNFQPQNGNPFVSSRFIKQFDLKDGQRLKYKLGKAPKTGKSQPIAEILEINGKTPTEFQEVADYKSVVVIDPEEPLKMKMGERDRLGKMMDMFTPMGKGQRGMIVSPPKAGKTSILKHIAKAISKNHPEIKIYILLIDERPEEITDFQRELPNATVCHSSSDKDVEQHVRITNLTMQTAIREAEVGDDVIVLIDSLTRMGRAYNKDTESSGRTLSGGLGATAMELPRRFFGAARNIEHGGSLTIMATILVDTGSRMDEVIFQEFKGTGNLDLVLSRECAERRLFPAFDIKESGTRKEHKLLSFEDLDDINFLRRKVAGMRTTDALEYVLENL